MDPGEIEKRLSGLKGWKLAAVGDRQAIAKTLPQSNFLAGLGLVTRVAVLAEKANHHPDVLLTYPRVTFTLTTHDAGGLTAKDFSLAAEIDAL